MSVFIYTQDCLTGMREHLKNGAVDVVVTSCPYNIGTLYREHDDTQPREMYLAWCGEWLRQIQRTLAPQGSFFLNVDGSCKDPWVGFDVANVARQYFTLQNRIAWVKSMSPDLAAGEPVEGHVKPLNSERYLNHAWEFLFHFTHTGTVPLDRLSVGVRYADETNLKRDGRGKNGNRRCAGDVWHIPYRTIQSGANERPHPATFPEELAERCIRLHGLERTRLVIDPFMGIGTTGRACAKLGVRCIGFEIDAEYAKLARARSGAHSDAETDAVTLAPGRFTFIGHSDGKRCEGTVVERTKKTLVLSVEQINGKALRTPIREQGPANLADWPATLEIG